VARVADTYAHAHRNREPLEVEFRLAREDGMYRWLVDYGRPRFGESGAFVGFIGSGIDITERKHAEATVRASEERYRAVIESQSEMLCRFRADGTILFVNGAYARVQGKEPEGIVGTNFWEFVSEDDRADVQAQLDRLTPATPTVNIENRFETAMGTRWTLWTNRALAFDSEGHLLEAQSSGIDISERRAIEEELRRANSVKDELLGMVSHEFRTPLATIIGNLDVLERPATSPGQRARSFQDLRLSSGRLRRLIENMLVLASNRPGLDPEPEPLLLHRLLPAMLAMEQRLDESRPIELQADNGLPPVLGNLGYLEQVLGNLLSNARKYGKKGTPIHVAVTQDQGDVAIAVRDHGDVLASESLDRFFEPFYRDAGGASFVDGVGLGLSVCQRLVHAMGGEITASAHPEGGAIFRFTLPVARDDGEV
jgi:PAS domain S-box-containing protein